MLHAADTTPDNKRVLVQWHRGLTFAISDGKINLRQLITMGSGYKDGVMSTTRMQICIAVGRRLEVQIHKCIANPQLQWPVKLADDDGNDEDWGHRHIDRCCQEYRSRCRGIDWASMPSVGVSVDKVNCRGLDLRNGYMASIKSHAVVMVPQASFVCFSFYPNSLLYRVLPYISS